MIAAANKISMENKEGRWRLFLVDNVFASFPTDFGESLVKHRSRSRHTMGQWNTTSVSLLSNRNLWTTASWLHSGG